MDGQFRDIEQRINESVALVREVSTQTNPQEMVRRYRDRINKFFPRDASASLSRRELEFPFYRITRSSRWHEEIDPWKQPDRLPVLKGGMLAELIYANEPRVVNELKVDPNDPAAEFLEGMGALVALPLYDRGESLNMVIQMRRKPHSISLDLLPELIITSNLFGRATYNLVLAERARTAFEALDAEFKIIAEIQQALLPKNINSPMGLDLAAYYATAHRAGGDYYDIFPIDDRRTGIMIADVSGHGAAAAVVMARLHAALHANPPVLASPAECLEFATEQLLRPCGPDQFSSSFVTAFYAVYESATRSMVYSSAGHNPPRWRRADGSICSLCGARNIPLGIDCSVAYDEDCLLLTPDDELVLYTDGIVEAFNPQGQMFGIERLDAAMNGNHDTSQSIVRRIMEAVDYFVECSPTRDDQTLLALKVI